MSKQIRAYLLLLCALPALLLTAYASEGLPKQGTERTVDLPIVMYHHMSPKSKLWGDYVLPVDQFEQDLAYLKQQGYTPITTQQLLDWQQGNGDLPEKPVMITFDDGYESTYVYALPLLEQYGMTAVVSVIGSVAQLFTDQPDHMLDYSHMSWDAIADADAGNVLDVQCHTYDMHKLSQRKGCGPMNGEDTTHYAETLAADLTQFQREFSAHTGHETYALALPFGFYTQDTIQVAKDLGFQMVFTCTEKVNHLTGDANELLELCRYNRPYGPTSAEFFAQWETS